MRASESSRGETGSLEHGQAINRVQRVAADSRDTQPYVRAACQCDNPRLRVHRANKRARLVVGLVGGRDGQIEVEKQALNLIVAPVRSRVIATHVEFF